jgi:hypothetical protein
MPTVDLVILGKHGQIGNEEQVIEELNSAGLTMRLEDGYVVEMMMMMMLMTLIKLQNSLVRI